MSVNIPYGRRRLKCALPVGRVTGILEKRRVSPRDAGRLLSQSLARPLGMVTLEKCIAVKKSVLLVVPDKTRCAHLKTILPRLLKIIKVGGRSVTVIVATGLHKKHTDAEMRELLGAGIVKECRVICHDQDKRSLTDYGKTRTGIPVLLHRSIKEHDCIMTVGVIEPHLYAGYSGGFKTIAVGLAGAGTINVTHGIRFLDDPSTAIGSIKGNVFQDALADIAGKISIDFSVNIVNDAEGSPLKIFSGDTRKVFAAAVAFSKKMFEVETTGSADIVICGIGYPKDINLYQASRALNYIANTKRPVVRKGGLIIVAAELKDGIGTSATEARFHEKLKGMSSPEEFVAGIRKNGCIAGEHRTYMVAKALIDYNVAFVTSRPADFMEGLKLPCFNSIRDALKYADSTLGKSAKICVIPRALSTIASIKS